MSNPSHPNEPEQPDFAKLFDQLLGGGDPAMADALKSMGLDRVDPSMMAMLAGQLQAMFSAPADGGVDLDMCADVARKTVAAEGGDAIVSEKERRAAKEAGHVARLWLDEVTSFAAPGGPIKAWSRAEWVAETMPMWGRLVSPVAEGVTSAMTSALKGQLDQLTEGGLPEGMSLPGMPPGMGLPPGMDLSSMLGQMEPMLSRMSTSMFGAQIGRAVGLLAGEVLTGTEVGLPLVADGVVVLPTNIGEFAEGLEVDEAQVQLYLAVREAARVRLFHGAPWLGPQLVTAVQQYARDIRIDTEGIESKISTIDPTDPAAMQAALGDSLFASEPSPAQKAALTRLETLLALVEGWVDVVTEKATAAHLPQSAALGEAVRRRRASGGPSEQIFGQLVGLELRPRRLRDAANLWAALESASDAAGRDAAWAHPDVAPGAEDLDDPIGYVQRTVGPERTELSDDLDAALEAILSGEDSRRRAEDASAEGPADAGPWPQGTGPDDRPSRDDAAAGDPSDPRGGATGQAPGAPGASGASDTPGAPGTPGDGTTPGQGDRHDDGPDGDRA